MWPYATRASRFMGDVSEISPSASQTIQRSTSKWAKPTWGMTGMKGKTVHIRRKPLFCNKRFWLLRRRDEANIRTFEL